MHTLNSIAKTIGWILLIIWGLLTILVLISLIDRWANPGYKSVSNRDLLDYGKCSIWLFGLFGITKCVSWNTKAKFKSQNNQ